MKYNIPHKNLIKFLQDELKSSKLGFILNTRTNTQSYIGYSDIYSIFSNHIKKYALFTASSFDLNDYHAYPQELRNELDLVFNSLKQTALYIETHSLNSNQIKNTIKDILSELPYPPGHWDAEFDYNHLFFSQETFEDFVNVFEFMEFNKISKRVYSEYESVNINFGDETGTPATSIPNYENLFKIACIFKRLDTSEPIVVETPTPDNVVQALFPKSSKFIDDPYNEPFSFKNTDFLDTINEEIVDESFIQVATIDILLPNLESYLEDLQVMIAKHGYENYFTAAKKAISGKADKDNELEKFLSDFYQFVEKIPKEIMLNDDELQQIVDLFNRPCPELAGYPLIPPIKRTLSNSPYSNLVAIEFLAFIKTPPSMEKLFFYLPTQEFIKANTPKNPFSHYNDKSPAPIILVKGHQEDWSNTKQSLEVLTPLFNKHNNPYYMRESFQEYYKLPDLNIEDFLKFVEKHPEAKEQIALFNTIFESYWKVPEVRAFITYGILEFATSDQYASLGKGHFEFFIQDLSKDEIQLILNQFTSKYSDYDAYKNHFTPKGTLLFNSSEKTILQSLIKLQIKNLSLEFLDSLESYQESIQQLNDETKSYSEEETTTLNNQIKQQKDLVVETFLALNEFAIEHKIEGNSLLQVNFSSFSNNHKLNISKRFSEVQETFIFDFFNNELYQNTGTELTKQIFHKNAEFKVPFKHNPNQIYEHNLILEKDSLALSNYFLSFIPMDEVMSQKKHKENYTSDKWFKFLSKNIGGDMEKVVQHVINQSKTNFELLQQCQQLAHKKRIISNRFNFSNTTLRKMWEDPKFQENALSLYGLSSQVLEHAPEQFSQNPKFWIELIKNSDYLSSDDNTSTIVNATLSIQRDLMQHNDLGYELFMLHSHHKNIKSDSKHYSESHFYKSLCYEVQPTFAKPKYFLKLLEEIDRRNTSWNVVKDANANLYKFICDNNISEEEVLQKITVIINQSIMDKNNTNNHSSKPAKGLKF